MLEKIGDNIWSHNMRVRFGGIPLWHRMTAIRLDDGSVVLHSPAKLSPELRDGINQLGPVSSIVAPSWWHDMYLQEYLATWPEAGFYAASALIKWHRQWPSALPLGVDGVQTWDGQIDQAPIKGIGLFLDEVALFHRASRSLIVADMLFNVSHEDARITQVLAPIVIGRGCCFARMYRPFVFDKKLFRTSIQAILDWDFDQIVVGHGEIVRSAGKAAFRRAFAWIL